MSRLPDISEFYDYGRAVVEEANWVRDRPHDAYLAFLLPRLDLHVCQTVVEFGCGSGIVAASMPAEIQYLGIDRNRHFIELARRRNNWRSDRLFILDDVRGVDFAAHDCACAFAFVKHFGLSEIDTILAQVLKHGRYGCLEMQFSDHNFDNGVDYHHSFVTYGRFERAVHDAGHRIVEASTIWEGSASTGEAARSMLVWTQKGDPS